MLFYIIWFSIIVLLFIVSDSMGTSRLKSFLRWTGVGIAVLVSAFRYDVGRDYLSYRNMIVTLNANYEISEFLNKGLIYVSNLLHFPQFYFIVTTLLIFALVHKTVNRYGDYYTLSFLVFLSFPLFFANSLTIIRQFLAMSIIFYSVRFILDDRNPFKFALCLILAMGFHYSAIVAIPLFFVPKLRIKTWMFIALLIFPTLLKGLLVYIIINYAPLYSKYILFEYGLDAGGQKAVYLFVLISVGLVLIKDYLIASSKNNIFYFNSAILGTAIYLSLVDFGHIGMRVASFYLIFLIILIPNAVSAFKAANRPFVIQSIYALCYILFLITFSVGIKNGESSYIPYHSILFK